MAIYRELMFNNIEGLLRNAFPVLRSLYSEQLWLQQVRLFFASHRCETPYFARVAEEFLHWLQHEREARAEDPPFLFELAHYEWVELHLLLREAAPPPAGLQPNGDLLQQVPVMSDVALVLDYAFPVHRIAPDFRPHQADPESPALLLVYRDRLDEIHFTELNPMTHRLLRLLAERPDLSGAELLRQLAEETGYPADQLVLHGTQILEDLRRRGVLLGTRAIT